jgi:hypothetical protein
MPPDPRDVSAFSASAILEKVYAKVGQTGVLGVASLYLLYRYTRGLTDDTFAARLCSENAQAGIYGVDIPYVAITWTTPLIVGGLALWSFKENPTKLPARVVTAIRLVSLVAIALAGAFLLSANYGTVCDNPVMPASGYFRMGVWTPSGGPMDALVLGYALSCAAVALWIVVRTLRLQAKPPRSSSAPSQPQAATDEQNAS